MKVYLLIFIFFNLSFYSSAEAQSSIDKEEAQKKEQKELVKSLQKKKEKKDPGLIENSQKALWYAYALRDKKTIEFIDRLKLKKQKLPVFLVPTEKSLRPLIQLELDYPLKNWTLFDGEKVEIEESGEDTYKVYAFLRSNVSTVQLYAVGPKNQVQQEKIYIYAPEAREFKTTSVLDSLIFSTGYSYLAYSQSSFGTFIQNSLYLGIDYESPIKEKSLWGYYVNIDASLINISSSPVDEPTNYLEINAGVSYKKKVFPSIKMRSKLLLGITNTNLFTYGRGFGFTGLYGPQLGLKSEYFKSGNTSYSLNLAISPYELSNPFTERTLKLELSYNLNLNNLKKAQISLDYSNTTFTTNTEEISTDFFGLKYGISF